ncbi:hypothetical protein [Rhizomonospora bruguierae]|uniref:hypothetical protein n=1 Tax=Rhizomonospora bruguierae TaxID=1581705 RepID=UPI001BD0D7F5|nr:hypothetical protein [Micromonospora sp. NBRC 107566]
MPDTGQDLGADLNRLETMALRNLPNVAEQYGNAAARVNGTGFSVGAAFSRHTAFGGSTQGPALGPWIQLKDTIAGYLRDTADKLDATAEALELAVKAIADADQAAAAELDRLRGGAHRDVPPPQGR